MTFGHSPQRWVWRRRIIEGMWYCWWFTRPPKKKKNTDSFAVKDHVLLVGGLGSYTVDCHGIMISCLSFRFMNHEMGIQLLTIAHKIGSRLGVRFSWHELLARYFSYHPGAGCCLQSIFHQGAHAFTLSVCILKMRKFTQRLCNVFSQNGPTLPTYTSLNFSWGPSPLIVLRECHHGWLAAGWSHCWTVLCLWVEDQRYLHPAN